MPIELKQDQLLKIQEDEELQFVVPGPGGVEVPLEPGRVSEAGGVPGGRTPQSAQQIQRAEQAQRGLQQQLAGTDPNTDKAAHSKLSGQLSQVTAILGSLNEPSAQLETRQAEKVYASGNSHGFIALHSAEGKVKKVLFANGPGVTKTPTLQDLWTMSTTSGRSSAARELKSKAGEAARMWTNNVSRLGASADMRAKFGEMIQAQVEEDFLAGTGVTERINNNARDSNKAVSAVMNVMFQDEFPDGFKKEDLQVLETSTIDVDEDNESRNAVLDTMASVYEESKNDEARANTKNGMRAKIISEVFQEHRDYIKGLGKSGAFRLLNQVSQGVDAMRLTNFQQESAQLDMKIMQEEQTIMERGMNKIVTMFGSGSPQQKKASLDEAARSWVNIDNADQLVGVIGNESVGRFLEDQFNTLDDAFDSRSGVTLRNTSVAQQNIIVEQAVSALIAEELGVDSPDTHHVYSDLAHKMRSATQNGSLLKEFPQLTEVVNNLRQQYSLGVNAESVANQQADNDKRKQDIKTGEMLSEKINSGFFIKRIDNDGNPVWEVGKTPAAQIKGLRKMAANDEIWANFSLSVNGEDHIRKIIRDKGDQEVQKEVSSAINRFSRAFSPVMDGIRFVGSTAEAVRQKIAPSTSQTQGNQAMLNETLATMKQLSMQITSDSLPDGLSKASAEKKIAQARAFALSNNVTEAELNQLIGGT